MIIKQIIKKSSELKEVDQKPTIAIDFDGVIHKYSKGWQGGRIYDEPMEGAKEALEELSKKYRIIIFTTRTRIGIPPEIGIEKDTSNVWWWLNKNGLSDYIYDITNIKPKEAKLFIDDRAVRFKNWKDALKEIDDRIAINKSLSLKKLFKSHDQMDLFLVAGAEKEFGKNDRRRLEVTGSGKLRWKNADASTSSAQVQQSAEGKEQNEELVNPNIRAEDLDKLLQKKFNELGQSKFKDYYNNILETVNTTERHSNDFQAAKKRNVLRNWNRKIQQTHEGNNSNVNKISPKQLVKPRKVEQKKEPWEMTRNEFGKNVKVTTEIKGAYNKNYYVEDRGKLKDFSVFKQYFKTGHASNEVTNPEAAITKAHKDYIEQALKEGKPVPEEVLNDYPDLAEKYLKGSIQRDTALAPTIIADKVLRNTYDIKQPDFDELVDLFTDRAEHLYKNNTQFREKIKKDDKEYLEGIFNHWAEGLNKDKDKTVYWLKNFKSNQTVDIIKTLPGLSGERIFKNLADDEECLVERQYKEYKQLDFVSGKTKIESRKDVAYLFKQLADESVEHFFACWILEDGSPIVQHVSSGTFTSSLVDMKQLYDPVKRLNPKEVYLVHNHPSGNIVASNEDYESHKDIKQLLDGKVKVKGGIIIDGKDCKYGFIEPKFFNTTKEEFYSKANSEKEIPIPAISFSKQVLYKDVIQKRIETPQDVAEFITGSRFSTGNKTQLLCLNIGNQVVGRFNINPISKKTISKNADEILQKVISSGGLSFIIVGNQEPKEIESDLREIIKKIGETNIDLLDYIGVVSEKRAKNSMGNIINLKRSLLTRILKGFGKQESLFDEPYSKEGHSKPGKSGQLTLTRDQKGKGAHWRILNRNKEDRDADAQKPPIGKVITPSTAYKLLENKLGNKAFVTEKDGNLMGEGTFQLINENSEGNYVLFMREKNGMDSVIPVMKNQMVQQTNNAVKFSYADIDIFISLKEKSSESSKPAEIKMAEENARKAREMEKLKRINLWAEKADDFAELARGQKSWFFTDAEDVARNVGIEFSSDNKIIKRKNTLLKEIRFNAENNLGITIHSGLISAFEVLKPSQIKKVLSGLKDKGYEINGGYDTNNIIDGLKEKPDFFVTISAVKGKSDPLKKELQFATPGMMKAYNECLTKPNPLRESEFSLQLKLDAERISGYEKVRKQLFSKAGTGLGQLWVLGGIGGSGKSSTLEPEFYKNKVLIDPDKIKYLLAEERGLQPDNKTLSDLHEESSTIAKHLVRESIREGKDVIYDTTMKGLGNISDLFDEAQNDTFQVNAKFIHIPYEKGLERDIERGKRGKISLGKDLYEKLYKDYPTHKNFFTLKDRFDTFEVHDNTQPLGKGTVLFYSKEDGIEEVHIPDMYSEFRKTSNAVAKSIMFNGKWGREKMMKSFGNISKEQLDSSDKIKMLLGFKEGREIDPEQDFFSLGLLHMHGLIDKDMNITEAGEKLFEERFGSQFTSDVENKLSSIVNPDKNISETEDGL